MMTSDARVAQIQRIYKEFASLNVEAPLDTADLDHWLDRFRQMGYFSADVVPSIELDGQWVNLWAFSFVDDRSEKLVRLFRCAEPHLVERPHWTPHVQHAAAFAAGGSEPISGGQRHLYSVRVPGTAVLARINVEAVIDPRGLVVTDHGPISHKVGVSVRAADLPDGPAKAAALKTFGPDAMLTTTGNGAAMILDTEDGSR